MLDHPRREARVRELGERLRTQLGEGLADALLGLSTAARQLLALTAEPDPRLVVILQRYDAILVEAEQLAPGELPSPQFLDSLLATLRFVSAEMTALGREIYSRRD